jgi:hypothetical protein
VPDVVMFAAERALSSTGQSITGGVPIPGHRLERPVRDRRLSQPRFELGLELDRPVTLVWHPSDFTSSEPQATNGW